MNRLIAVLLLAAATVNAQARPELASVTKWRMNFAVTSKTSGDTSSALEGTYTWDFTSTATGSIVFTAVPGSDFEWQGITDVTVSGSYTSKWILPGGTCSFETNASFRGTPDDVKERPAVLSMVRDDGFEFELGPTRITYPITTTEKCGNNTVIRRSEETFTWTPIWDVFPYPGSGTQLGGNANKKSQNIVGQIPPINDGDYTITFTIVPDVVEELSVEVDNTEAYKEWRPEAASDGSAGAPLSLTARLVSSTGKAPNARVSSVKWELKNTSKEPGIALNWPVDAADTDFDLKLDTAGPSTVFDERGQWIERFQVSGFEDSATIIPFDWGAWADLEVTFALNDGRTLKGKLKPGGDNPIRIPNRAPDSRVADKWKRTLASKGKRVGADRVDDDAAPEGDGISGDGLTVYEEYRGFYEDGTHIEGDPTTKDLFILDKSAGAGAGGVAKLQRLTRLAVHGKLQDAELPRDRVINKNTKEGAHVVDQHAITMFVDANIAGYAEARGGPGNPKMVSEVALPGEYTTWDAGYLNSTIAHELLHALNVYHHGEADSRVTWRRGGDGVLREFFDLGPAEGIEIRVRTETDEDVTDQVLSGATLWMGKKRGQHSGNHDCVMRYDCSLTYTSDADAKLRYLVKEAVGQRLCKSPNATGVNEPGRSPQSRYVEAAQGRGTCTSQLLVNDAVAAPRR